VRLPHGTLFVHERGDGRPLVLVHGMGSSHRSWHRVATALEGERRVLALDLPGFGRSDPVGPGFRPAAVAEAVGDALAALDVDEFDLVGHSLGGMVATHLADREPRRVRRLVLVAPAGLSPRLALPGPAVGRVLETLIGLRRELGMSIAANPRARWVMLRRIVHDPGRLPATDARIILEASRGATRIRQGVAAAIHGDIRRALSRLPMPVTVVWGREDKLLSPTGAEEAASWQPAARVHLLERCGHLPMLECPRRMVEVVGQVVET
jgi:pimeloyl-ACP methyl ester carboxylesterase